MNYELIKLNNGLNTLFVHSPGSTSGSTQIWFRAGSALEKPKDHGIAHFLEHMFFKGTLRRPGAKIAHDVESFGGEINAFTSFDYTCYYINSPTKYLKPSIDILMDMVSDPMFKLDDLIPERDVVHEEYKRSIDSPNQFAFMNMQQHSFTGGYQHPILGSEKHIKNFSREQLIEFRKTHYNTENALLVISGDLKLKKDFIKTIEKYSLPSGKNSKFPEFHLKDKTTLHVHSKEVSMVQLNITLEGLPLSHNNAAAEDLAFNCLGHGETSRLYQSLVIKNSLASNSSASTMFMNKGGAHFIKIVTPFKNLKTVLSRLNLVFANLLQKGFEEDEVKRIKNQYVASKIYEMESLESYSFSLGHSYAQTGDLGSEEQFVQRIKQCSLDDVNRGLQAALSRPMHIHALIPKKESTAEAKILLTEFSKAHERIKKQTIKSVQEVYPITYSKFDPQVQLVTIKPGVKLVYRQNTMNPTFILHAYLRGGLSEENEKINGQYHLLSNLLSKGHSEASYHKLKTELENASASFGGFTGKNAYGLTMHGQTEDFAMLTKHFMNSLLAPKIDAKLLKHEKNLTQRALESMKEDAVRQCFQAVNEVFFKGHPYSQNILGTKKTVAAVTREDLLELHQKRLKSEEILLTYCGNLSLNEVIKFLNPFVSKLKNRKTKPYKLKKISKQKPGLLSIPFAREQTHLFYGVQIGSIESDDNLILKMLTTYLSGQSSELFVEVRDRQGLCYTAQPIHFNALEGGYWGIYMATGNEKVGPAIEAIKKILLNISGVGLGLKEFERIKKMMEGQALLNVQTNDDYANIYSIPLLQGLGLDYYHLSNEQMNKLSYEKFRKRTEEILLRPWNTIIVGVTSKE